MYRPQPLKFFESMIPPSWPIGPLLTSMKATGGVIEEINISIYCCFSNSEPSIVKIRYIYNLSTIIKSNDSILDFLDHIQIHSRAKIIKLLLDLFKLQVKKMRFNDILKLKPFQMGRQLLCFTSDKSSRQSLRDFPSYMILVFGLLNKSK